MLDLPAPFPPCGQLPFALQFFHARLQRRLSQLGLIPPGSPGAFRGPAPLGGPAGLTGTGGAGMEASCGAGAGTGLTPPCGADKPSCTRIGIAEA